MLRDALENQGKKLHPFVTTQLRAPKESNAFGNTKATACKATAKHATETKRDR